jgi:mono/diheme cytochrome c family protein
MKKSDLTLIVTGVAFIASAVGIAAFAGDPKSSKKTSKLSDQPDLVHRGEYLVHRVGLCIDCHSPRNERGEFMENQHLTGSPVGFKPLDDIPWMPVAPRLAGLPTGYSENAMVHFLMTGERPNGLPPVLPPMPPYRLSREDAEAVTGYLHSLPGD